MMYDIEIEREVCRLPAPARAVLRGFDRNWREQVQPILYLGAIGIVDLLDRAFEYHEVLISSVHRLQAIKVIEIIAKKYSVRVAS